MDVDRRLGIFQKKKTGAVGKKLFSDLKLIYKNQMFTSTTILVYYCLKFSNEENN